MGNEVSYGKLGGIARVLKGVGLAIRFSAGLVISFVIGVFRTGRAMESVLDSVSTHQKSRTEKGKCSSCGWAWYRCNECGDAGCANDRCEKQAVKDWGFFSGERCITCGE